MNKETFDKAVAAIWELYNAAKTINDAGIGSRVTNEQTQAVLRAQTAKIGEELAAGLAA